MTERLVNTLNFIDSNSLLPTVEVDLDSIPEENFGYEDIVINSLKLFANKNSNLKASIYVYQGESINFHENTFSAFFGVDGKQNIKILENILTGFKKIEGVKARFSDYILGSNGFLEFHIEDGTVWHPLDAEIWYSDSEENKNNNQKLEKPSSHIIEDKSMFMNKVLVGKTGWTQDSGATKIDKAIIRNNELEIVIEFNADNYIYTAILTKDIEDKNYRGSFSKRNGSDIGAGTISCSLIKYDEDTILFGRWVENNITYYWWAELYDSDQ